MNRYFYMGVDASEWDACTVAKEAKTLLNNGLFDAGYRTILLGENFEEKTDVMNELVKEIFESGITVNANGLTEEKLAAVRRVPSLKVVRIVGSDDVDTLKKAAEAIKAVNGRAMTEVQATKDNAEEVAKFADIVYYAPRTDIPVDYFAVARHQIDSCYDEDTLLEHSDSVIRANLAKGGKRYAIMPLPQKFNFFKNQSLYFVWVVLGVPIVLGTKPSELEARTVELLKDEEIIAYASADGEMGKVVYYYSPWHALFGRDFGTKQLMLCLNRCHGDSPMNILPDRDFANKKPDPFSVYDLYEKKTLAYRAGHFEIYVETSDHPLNPNARLLLIDEAKC